MKRQPSFHQRVKEIHRRYRAGLINREEYLKQVKAGRFDQVMEDIDRKYERYYKMLEKNA
ncbi:hypothetical protein [Desmospora activa]|uniref:Uncharacterized protein n=1 Tax=Desmospora activa DSM 45169 TaxID=1121389 RepID=A0A2T4Z3L4_9BACL|nr:hypothetical protein [Desmospora activa]PTM56478.1 hypothetical protein C8J48_2800 [Desmospora activa DSM 45169]